MISPLDLFYAAKLKTLRESKGMIQYTAAQLLGCIQQEYSALELGKRKFTLNLIKKIAAAFQVSNNVFTLNETDMWFNIEVFKYITSRQCSEHTLKLLGLFYKLVALQMALAETEKKLKTQWFSLTGVHQEPPYPNCISIGYFNASKIKLIK